MQCNWSPAARLVAAVVGAALLVAGLTPWAVPHRVLFRDVSCKYCYKSICPQGHHHCLRLVKPAEVVEAALALLEEPPAPAIRAGG